MSSSATDIWLTSRGLALHCSVSSVDAGTPVVVFVPGLCANAAVFAPFTSALADEGLNVVSLDLQGHGISEGRRGHIPFASALANIAEAVSFARERFGTPVALSGSGLGGMLAFYAALEDPRVAAAATHTVADLRSIAAFEPGIRGRFLASLAGRARRFESAAPLVRVPVRAMFPLGDFFDDPDGVRALRDAPRTVWWYTLESLASIFLTPDDKPAVEAFDRPLFVVTGEEDRVVPLAGQVDACARIADAELSVLGGAGHMIPLEHTAETAARVGGWLRKVL